MAVRERALIGYLNETETDTLSRDGNSYTGTDEVKLFDLNGNLLQPEPPRRRASSRSGHGHPPPSTNGRRRMYSMPFRCVA
jgi:hypothetical protein